MMKRIIIAIIVIGVLGAIFARYFLFAPRFRYLGTIEATKVDVPARLSSLIDARLVEEGDKVEANQPIIRLDCREFRIIQSIAQINFQRTLKLFELQSVPQEQVDTMKNRKDDADLHVEWCVVAAPLKATVLNKYHEAGEWVQPGTRLFTLADLKNVWAYVYVPETMLAKLKVGMQLKGLLSEIKGKDFPGTILKINSEAEFTPKNVQTLEERTRLIYGVKVNFVNADDTLKPGMTIEVKFPE